MLLFAGFGWAKPVPVNRYNFRYPSRDDILVSLGGVTANLLSAIGLAAVFVAIKHAAPEYVYSLYVKGVAAYPAPMEMLRAGVIINLVLLFFNVIPIPPLDGSHVLHSYLPYRLQVRYEQLYPYAPFILVLLVLSGATGLIIGGPVKHLSQWLMKW